MRLRLRPEEERRHGNSSLSLNLNLPNIYRCHCATAPPELERIGVTDYREVHFKPYRLIYQIIGKKVFVHCVLDWRRDSQELLERRLLR